MQVEKEDAELMSLIGEVKHYMRHDNEAMLRDLIKHGSVSLKQGLGYDKPVTNLSSWCQYWCHSPLLIHSSVPVGHCCFTPRQGYLKLGGYRQMFGRV